MASTLVCPHIVSRLYATKFLRVLLRTPLSRRIDYTQWVIELLANQLSDQNPAVSLAAVAALDEACDCKEYLEALINLRPSLLHLGDKGLLLLVRFLSSEKGFHYMSEANFIPNQLSRWAKFNNKYVCIVEGELADGLTLVERNEDGRYSSRLSHSKQVPGDVYVPPHLYGQLAQHSAGLDVLLADENVSRLVQVVLLGQCSSDDDILELKAALWALGHISSTPNGAVWARHYGITKAFVTLACSCPVYSIRSTAFHAIALTASNDEGADTLRRLGWHSVRHHRNQQWPVVAPLSLLEDALLQYKESCRTRDSSESTTTDSVTKNGLFILGEDKEDDENESFTAITARERVVRERKSATLPPVGSSHTFHHNRSYSESKADSDWGRSTTPTPAPASHSGSDITDFRSQENSRLYSESSTSSCGEPSQARSERLTQTLSPIPSTNSLATAIPPRKISVASSTGFQLSPKDMVGYATLRSLHRSRRPTLFASPQLSLHFSQSAPSGSVSPLSPIELIAFQDWKQMSPLVRPKHIDNHPIEMQFEVNNVDCPLPGDSHSSYTLHYESSRSCIAQLPSDTEELNSGGPCYQGISLPHNLVDLFPSEGISLKVEEPPADNNSTTGMDVSSCDSESDTAGEGEVEGGKVRALPPQRRHQQSSCLLCSVSRLPTHKQPRWRKISASSQHRIRTETESSYGGVGNEGESPITVAWQTRGGLEGITSIDSSSTDITSFTHRTLGDSLKSRSVVRKDVLRLAEQLCNPILYKTCKQTLLQLKQVYGDVFNDICIYSDVCAIMASASLRIYARRFLHELFLDAPFSEMYDDVLGILNIQNNTENEDGAGGDKLPVGSEAVVAEETVEPDSWKVSVPKVNGFDPEQRIAQGYELEVILESDARSEGSDMCRGRSSTFGSHNSMASQDTKVMDLLENLHITEDEDQNLIQKNILETFQLHQAPENESSSVVGNEIETPLDTRISQNNNLMICDDRDKSEEPDVSDSKMVTLSKNSKELRKEFFTTAIPQGPDVISRFDKEFSVPITVESSDILKKNDESFVTKVTDFITKSQGMLDIKLPPSQNNKKEMLGSDSSSKLELNEEGVVKQETFVLAFSKENLKKEDKENHPQDIQIEQRGSQSEDEGFIKVGKRDESTELKSEEIFSKPNEKYMTKVKEEREGSAIPKAVKKVNSSPIGSHKYKLEKNHHPNQESSSGESVTSVNSVSVLKSPQLTKKGKRNSNTKLSNKSEVPMAKTAIDRLTTTLDVGVSNPDKASKNLPGKNEIKFDPFAGKKDVTKLQTKPILTDGVNDASTSKINAKSAKSKLNESLATVGKPPSGSGRQRKKATTKIPNRDSIEPVNRKSESDTK